jgi:hypothetical protein
VRATIVIPAAKKARSSRARREYVSPGTAGLIVVVSQVSGSTTTTYSDTGYDVKAPSSACSVNGTTGNTTCTIIFNAPPTNASASQSDLFSIYAYDEPQTGGPLPTTNYTPFGDLLSEDIGPSGTGDAVPSTPPNTTNGTITAGALTNLTFVLRPVVAMPVASINGTFATTAPPSTLTLSVSGNGGTSNVLTVQGDDATGKEIALYLNGSGDDVYVNPIQEALSPPRYAATPSTVTSALTPTVTVTYTFTAADQPTSATSTAPSGTDVISDSLPSGGYDGASSYPMVSQDVTIAPLFAYAPTPGTPTATGFSTTVYAIQNSLPTGDTGFGNYSLSASTAGSPNDCSEYPPSVAPAAGGGNSQQAVFTVVTAATPGAGTTCTYALSDGFSNTTITFNPDGTQPAVAATAARKRSTSKGFQ